jgi:hypothetical protein
VLIKDVAESLCIHPFMLSKWRKQVRDGELVPEAFVGCVLGLVAAGLIHWIAPAPEPIVLEGGLVAAGFIGGLVVNWLTERRSKDRERR